MYVLNKYFIDTENVCNDWIDIIKNITKQDNQSEFYVFYTKNTTSLNYQMLDILLSLPDNIKIKLIECNCGRKNALDFHLVAEIGRQSATSKKSHYIIVSNDKGYEPLIKTYNNHGYHMERLDTKTNAEIKKEKIEQSLINIQQCNSLLEIAKKYNIDGRKLTSIYNGILKGKTINSSDGKEKQILHNKLKSEFNLSNTKNKNLYMELKEIS